MATSPHEENVGRKARQLGASDITMASVRRMIETIPRALIVVHTEEEKLKVEEFLEELALPIRCDVRADPACEPNTMYVINKSCLPVPGAQDWQDWMDFYSKRNSKVFPDTRGMTLEPPEPEDPNWKPDVLSWPDDEEVEDDGTGEGV